MQSNSDLFELASIALACRKLDTLLRAFAVRAGTALDAQAVLVWLNDPEAGGLVCRESGGERKGPERLIAKPGAVKTGLLKEVCGANAPQRLNAQEIAAVPLDHLEETFRARLHSALYLPLTGDTGAVGVVEILNKRAGPFTDEDAQFWGEAARLAGQAERGGAAHRRQLRHGRHGRQGGQR